MFLDYENDTRNILLYVSHLKKYFDVSSSFLSSKGKIKAVDDVTFILHEGETLGVVGETGCGKTTLGRTILRLTDATDGNVYFNLPQPLMREIIEKEERYHGLLLSKDASGKRALNELENELEHLRAKYSLTRARGKTLKEFRKNMQPIFQDPFSSLDPRKLIKDIIAEPMRLLTDLTEDQIFEKSKKLIDEIGLSEDHLYRFPHEFSGGQRQRIGIARAISIEPKLLILDEPTSALDVSVQAQILNLLRDLQQQRGLSYMFISHHLNVIRLMSDRVAVMYLGKLVELANTDKLFTNMLHPYTKALLSAIPSFDPARRQSRIILEGEIPSPADPPKGCYFHPRCPVAMVNCGWSPRDLVKPVAAMLEPYNNPEAADVGEVKEVAMDEQANIVDIVLAKPKFSLDKSAELIKNLIHKESMKKGGVRFTAVQKVSNENPDTIRLLIRNPDTPRLIENSPGHFVSCLIYESKTTLKETVRSMENPVYAPDPNN